MHQPVTNDPLVIMFINMVIVFAVLTAVWGLIEITHMIDPPAAQPVGGAAPAAPAAPAAKTGGLNAETVAVIAAAVSACGCSADQIQAIRPAEQPAWTGFGRVSGMRS